MKMVYETPHCFQCGRSTTLTLERIDYERWRAGAYVQHVWPHWSDDERELLMTGIHAECWDALFPEEEEGGDIAVPVD